MKNFSKIPLTACGTSLAVASLGNLIGVRSLYLKSICGLIALVMLILITLKILILRQDFKIYIREVNNISVFPTYFMTIMTLLTYADISVRGVNLSAVLWIAAFTCHIFFTVMFIKNQVTAFNIYKVLPNWFITCVAYALVGIAAPSYNLALLGQIVVIVALTCYFILLPVTIYRVLIIKNISESVKPAIWLYNSPINICIVAYMSSFGAKNKINPVFLLILLSFSLFSLFFSIAKTDFKSIIKNRATTSLSPFTFPTVILVTALKNVYYYFYDNGWFKADWSAIFIFLETICAVIVFGVIINYILRTFVIKTPEVKPEENYSEAR